MKKFLYPVLSLLLIVVATLTISIMPVSAKSDKVYNVVDGNYRATQAMVKYHIEKFTIKNGKTITLDAFTSNNLMYVRKSNGVKISNKEILKMVRFDIHVYTKSGKCVNYKYGVCDGGKFKVMSNVKGIKEKEYVVKITGYITNYKTLTFKSGDHANLAMKLKYEIKY